MSFSSHQQGQQFVPPVRPPVGFPNVAPPFSGAPPLPPGVNINPQQWQAGIWQQNPAYNPQMARPTQYAPWIPGASWHRYAQTAQGQQQQQQQQQQQPQGAFNPFKRPHKPPSAEYLANKLLDNPLGLWNMIPAEELEKQGALPKPSEEDVKSTPWIWAPLELDEDSSQSNDNTNGNHSHNRAQSQTRQASEPQQQIYNNGAREGGSSRQSSTDSSHASRSSIDIVPFNGPPLGRPKKYRRSTDPPDDYPASGGLAYYNGQQQHQPQQQQPSQPMEAYTSKLELKPTFTPGIIRTPGHYSSPNRTGSRNSYDSGTSASRNSSMDSVTSQMGHLSTDGSSLHGSMSSSSSSNISLSGVSAFSDEPASVLSPLIMADKTPRPSTRPIGRHGSAPTIGHNGQAPLGTIPESREHYRANIYASSTPNPSLLRNGSYPTISPSPVARPGSSPHPSPNPPSRSSSRPSSQNPSPVTSNNNSPYSYSGDDTTPSPSRRDLPNARDRPRTNSYGHVSSPSSERFQPPRVISHSGDPPMPLFHESTYPRSSSSASTSANRLPAPPRESLYPASRPAPQGPNIRQGFWNRRGDHLTADGYIVYAPPDRAYPHELKSYPKEREGYQDQAGAFAEFIEERIELPDSLPRHGKPPVRPYATFVQYI